MRVAVLGLLLAGCVTAPKDIGVGNYAEIRTQSGNIFAQAEYSSPLHCEMAVRQAWSQLVGGGLTARCMNENAPERLPYVIRIRSSPYQYEALQYRHATTDSCLSTVSFLTKNKIDFTSYCYAKD